MKKNICTVLILVLAISYFPVHAGESGSFAPLNPAFEIWRSERQSKKPMTTRDNEKTTPDRYRVSGKRPSPYSFRHLHNQAIVPSEKKTMDILSSSMPERFDLRESNKVTRVKNQGSLGTCWTFGALGSAESSALLQNWNDPNFSKKHLGWFAYTDIDDIYVAFDITDPHESIYEQGGTALMAIAMLSRWTGVVDEEVVPYQDFDTPPPANAPNVALLKKTLMAPSGDRFTDNVKHLLMEFGAVNIDVFIDNPADDWDDTLNGSFNPETFAFYYAGDETESNHAVLAVGWDDTYDKNNFLTPPAANGAWIVQNSYGEDWGDGGYFYVSYYDAVTGKQEDEDAYAHVITSPVNYHTVHFHDPLGITGAYKVGDDGGDQWFSNVFTSEQDQYIHSAGLYVLNLDTTLHIRVYTDPELNDPADGTPVMSPLTVTRNIPGYHIIDFDEPVFVKKGQRFSIVVQIQTGSQEITEPIAIEKPEQEYASNATAGKGDSFVSPDGENWTDMTDIAPDTNVCLKALGSEPRAYSGLMGDVGLNGKIDLFDVILVIRYAAGMTHLTDLQKQLGNVTGHADASDIGLADAMAILKLISGETSSFSEK